MGNILDGVGLHEVVVPVVCFFVCIAFQTWEIAGSHDAFDKCRGLFKAVRTGWVKENYMKGTIAVNTTRDYLKSAVFFASSAITLTTFTVGYAGSRYTDCTDEGSCSPQDWLFIVKLGVLAAMLLSIFFSYTQCTRFIGHFSFCMNTREFNGVPITQSLLVNVFNHAHWYNSLGMRLYFGTIPVFAWIFHSWALLAVTPMYLYMVWGLEDAGFVKDDIEESEKQRTALSAPLGGAAAPLGSEQDSMKRH